MQPLTAAFPMVTGGFTGFGWDAVPRRPGAHRAAAVPAPPGREDHMGRAGGAGG